MLTRAFANTTRLVTRTPAVRAFASASAFNKDWKDKTILVAGCRGQIGTELTKALVRELGANQVIAADLVESDPAINCKYYQLDVTDKETYEDIVQENKVDYILHLAAILSSLGEQHPTLAYDVNVTGATNALNIARDNDCQIFIPSSIAAFGGPNFPKMNTPDDTVLQPTTIYGVSKVFNELLGQYYFDKFGVDFRSLRYPGVISSQKFAFNGTTDYSTEIFFHALEKNSYDCWLEEGQKLPMIYIDDCIKATIKFLRTDRTRLNRSTYNLAGISFAPKEFNSEVEKLIPGLNVTYNPCPRRQAIAESWPMSLDDQNAFKDWGWQYNISLYELAKKILVNIDDQYKEGKHLNLSDLEAESSGLEETQQKRTFGSVDQKVAAGFNDTI